MKQLLLEKLSTGAFQNIEFFDGLPQLQLRLLLENATKQTATHREYVISEGDEADYFILVLSGAFKLIKKSGDSNTVFDFAIRNDLVGTLLMNDSRTFPISLAAIGVSEYLKIPRETYQKYWTQQADIVSRVQKATARRMEALQFGRILQTLPTDKKMAAFLLRLNETTKLNPGNAIEIQLTRKDIAEAIGTRVETAIRILSQWQKQGLIKFKSHTLQILRPDDLVKIYQNTKT